MFKNIIIFISVLLLLTGAAYGNNNGYGGSGVGNQGNDKQVGNAGGFRIGAEGGTFTSDDVTIDIPAGIVAGVINITTPMDYPPFPVDVNPLKIFELSPDGLSFIKGIVKYTDLIELENAIEELRASGISPVILKIKGFTDGNITLITAHNGGWRFVEDTKVVFDDETGTYMIIANLRHFSNYAVVPHITVPAAWGTSMPYDSAIAKVKALKLAWGINSAPTDEDYVTYLKNTLTPGVDEDLGLRPYGEKSCETASTALKNEFEAVPEINDTYNIMVVNTGMIFLGASQPIPHFMVKIEPKDDQGPSFLFDRYNFVEMHQIEGMYFSEDTKTDNIFEDFMKCTVEEYYKVDTLSNPDAIIDSWIEIVESYAPPPPPEPEILGCDIDVEYNEEFSQTFAGISPTPEAALQACREMGGGSCYHVWRQYGQLRVGNYQYPINFRYGSRWVEHKSVGSNGLYEFKIFLSNEICYEYLNPE